MEQTYVLRLSPSGRDGRVARYYTLRMHTDEKGQAEVRWAKKDAVQQLAEELDGTYLLRTDSHLEAVGPVGAHRTVVSPT